MERKVLRSSRKGQLSTGLANELVACAPRAWTQGDLEGGISQRCLSFLFFLLFLGFFLGGVLSAGIQGMVENLVQMRRTVICSLVLVM